MSDLNSVVVSKKVDGSWQAIHVPSGKAAFGESAVEAQEEMRRMLGVNEEGKFEEPLTSHRFEGPAKEVAVFLETKVSAALASHSGFARLENFVDGVAEIRLGGGCQGCPSSQMTLVHGVKKQLQDAFGEDVVRDVAPVLESASGDN